MNILFVHLLNNYTGSPKVLSNIIKELVQCTEYKIKLLTSKTEGCLSGIKKITYYVNHYKWVNNKIVLICRFFMAQVFIFIFILIKSKSIDIIYINTLLPFSAAIAGILTKKKIIYHIHEVYLNPNIIQKIMYFIANKYASQIVSVSYYVNANMHKTSIIYNTVSKEFEYESQKLLEDKNIAKYKYCKKNILMVSSLKKYKGIDIFVSLARKCQEYSFSLVSSSPQTDIVDYFSYTSLSNNLTIIPQKKNLLPYYRDASIVLNLSLPDLCIEAFGMTLLEGLQCGTPCIAPDFGGPKEIILNGRNGFLVNPYDEESIIRAMNTILHSETRYAEFFANALDSRGRFSIDSTMKLWYEKIDDIILKMP
jgi:glycosyltransferase involved in cell wall biosynthesis